MNKTKKQPDAASPPAKVNRAQRAVAAEFALRRTSVVASDETGVRIEGFNAYHWVSRRKQAVVHHADPIR